MWYWTVVEIKMVLDVLPWQFNAPCWHIVHKVSKNLTASNPWQDAKDWVVENKKEGSEYVILEMFFV